MRRLASELHDRIDAWIVNFGRKLDRANTTSDKQMKALDGWDSFTSHLWEKRDSSVTVFVPCSSWDKVADSRALYRRLGPKRTAELFVRLAPGEHPDFPDGHDDKTHFNAYGAEVIAGLVADELRRLPQCAGFMRQA